MQGKELCNCGKVAVWLYMPATNNPRRPFFCEDCVPRGCTCNHYHIGESIPLNLPTESDKPYIWIEPNLVWTRVDDKGRQWPCVEYDYEEEGYDIDEK